MTTLSPDPFVVALMQAADTLPICLLALPAGALADIFDKRKFLLSSETKCAHESRPIWGFS
jgi:Transmembrane secretion effector